MKYNILKSIAVISTVLMTACTSSEEPAATEHINYGVDIDSYTDGSRAGYTYDMASFISNGGGFRVMANIDDNSSKNYFSWLTYKSSDNGASWREENGTVYPFPSQGKAMRFYAYSPVNLGKDNGNGANPAKINLLPSGFAIENVVPNVDAAKHDDIMLAFNNYDLKLKQPSPVDLKFKHLLAELEIDIVSSNERVHMRVMAAGIFNLKSGANFVFQDQTINGKKVTRDDFQDADISTEEGRDIVDSFWRFGPSSIGSGKNNYYTWEKYNEAVRVNTQGFRRFPQNKDQAFLVVPQNVTSWNKDSQNTGTWIGLLANVTISGDDDGVTGPGQGICIFPAGSNPNGYYSASLKTDITKEQQAELRYAWIAIPFPAIQLHAGGKYRARVMVAYGAGSIGSDNAGGIGYYAPIQPELTDFYSQSEWDKIYQEDAMAKEGKRKSGDPILGHEIAVQVEEAYKEPWGQTGTTIIP